MYDGISNSIDILSNVEGRRVIIVLSDGLDNASQNNADSILSRVESSELSIYTIGLGDTSLGANPGAGIDEANLRSIAEQSRGVYAYAPNSQSLSALYENLSNQLQNEYRLTYQTTNTVRDGVGRSLEIQIEIKGLGKPFSIRAG